MSTNYLRLMLNLDANKLWSKLNSLVQVIIIEALKISLFEQIWNSAKQNSPEWKLLNNNEIFTMWLEIINSGTNISSFPFFHLVYHCVSFFTCLIPNRLIKSKDSLLPPEPQTKDQQWREFSHSKDDTDNSLTVVYGHNTINITAGSGTYTINCSRGQSKKNRNRNMHKYLHSTSLVKNLWICLIHPAQLIKSVHPHVLFSSDCF